MQSKVDPYCFIEFYDHRTAEQAIKTMNKEYAFGKVSALEQVFCMTEHRSCATRDHGSLQRVLASVQSGQYSQMACAFVCSGCERLGSHEK